MKLSSNQLEAFYAVAKTGNFTKAAKLINVTQSALSQRVLNLESEIQTTLFIRDRSGIVLTEAAQELLRYCDLQEQFEAEFLGKLKSKNKDVLAGVIRIAGFSSVMRSVVLPTLTSFLNKNPRVQLQLQTKETYELLPMLKRGETDFIILDEKLARDEIETRHLGYERNVLVQREGYSGGDDVYLDHDIQDETTLRYLKMTKRPTKGIQRHYLDDIYGILEGARSGLGRAVVPEHLIKKSSGLIVKNSNVALESPVVLHFYRQSFYSSLHQSVINLLETAVSQKLDGKSA